VHVTLYRLEDKGFVKSRIFTITNAGLAMLRNMKEARTDLWKLVPRLNYDLL